MNKFINKIVSFFTAKSKYNRDTESFFEQFMMLTEKKRVILNVSVNNKLILQIERVTQADGWDVFFKRNDFGNNAFLFYFVKNAEEYQQEHLLQNVPSDFNQIIEDVDNRKVETYTKIVNVDTTMELQILMDNMILSLYDDYVVKEPKDISLFEVYK